MIKKVENFKNWLLKQDFYCLLKSTLSIRGFFQWLTNNYLGLLFLFMSFLIVIGNMRLPVAIAFLIVVSIIFQIYFRDVIKERKKGYLIMQLTEKL